jgi:hypothetical protein
VRLGPVRSCVCDQVCVCVRRAPRTCLMKGRTGLAVIWTRRHGVGALSPHTARPWQGRGTAVWHGAHARVHRQGQQHGACVRVRARRGAVDVWPATARRGRARLGSRCGCACTLAGSGLPGPRCGRAVCGAPASRARDTTRRRRGDGGGGLSERCDGLLHKGDTVAGWERGPKAGLMEGSSASPAARGKKGESGGAHR